MPYIISVTAPRATARTANGRDLERHERSGSGRDTISSVAVATIEETREAAQNAVIDGCATNPPQSPGSCAHHYDAASTLGEQGGTIGPMPDGYVIEVQFVTWPDLWRLSGSPVLVDDGTPASDKTLDAFNER